MYVLISQMMGSPISFGDWFLPFLHYSHKGVFYILML